MRRTNSATSDNIYCVCPQCGYRFSRTTPPSEPLGAGNGSGPRFLPGPKFHKPLTRKQLVDIAVAHFEAAEATDVPLDGRKLAQEWLRRSERDQPLIYEEAKRRYGREVGSRLGNRL